MCVRVRLTQERYTCVLSYGIVGLQTHVLPAS